MRVFVGDFYGKKNSVCLLFEIYSFGGWILSRQIPNVGLCNSFLFLFLFCFVDIIYQYK